MVVLRMVGCEEGDRRRAWVLISVGTLDKVDEE